MSSSNNTLLDPLSKYKKKWWIFEGKNGFDQDMVDNLPDGNPNLSFSFHY